MTVRFQYERIKERRKEQNLTQEILAELCGCSPRHLRNLEAGIKRNPSAALVRQLAWALNISMEELLVIQEDAWGWTKEFKFAVWKRHAGTQKRETPDDDELEQEIG